MAVALSTKDNPYNPFTQWDQWLNYDMLKGPNCCAYLARIAKTSSSMTDYEVEKEINRAIDEIISLDFTHQFIKVVE